MSYDTAITVFGPGGNLFQVEYAMNAVKQGQTSVGVRGKDCIVIGVEKKSTTALQEPRTIRKVLRLDESTCIAFSGLTADARILSNIAKVECQSYRLNYDDRVPINYISRYIAGVQQKYTQKGGARPFGISTLVGGFDSKNQPRLYQTDPSGACTEWKADALGRSRSSVIEFLEKNYLNDQMNTDECLKLACKALLDVVESGSKNIELFVQKYNEFYQISEEEVESIVKNVNL
ncbi:proteasome alpha 7 subunit, putative [Ichthyophthirius multifiliis]|uniref:Proteasome alpha 7 subunit, putative n=1 Tax=Ichthyophthirius multifiliis TaxID=5932 RepID=G0QJK2_ICHMU|nr:proteasome alpha 7 subunit, putative [Ichthyophthirius multifiliis]EGR34603.1 proteasome alpha 7 subunit, putative [Ichthyophthirius multifiliis]|eukprot:XP_004039907.1 proteasome alpha 7 subunit, putative [Ichthyophthirius multifiliis]